MWAAPPPLGETPVVNTHSNVVISSQCVGISLCVCECGTYDLQERLYLDVVVVEHTELCVIVNNIRATEEIPHSWRRHGVHQLVEQQLKWVILLVLICFLQFSSHTPLISEHIPDAFCHEAWVTGMWSGWGTGIPWMNVPWNCRNCGCSCRHSSGEVLVLEWRGVKEVSCRPDFHLPT